MYIYCLEKCRQTLAYLGYDYLSPAVASKPSPLALNKVSNKSILYIHISSPDTLWSCYV